MGDYIVTTAIGFKCDDGVVLGTDTQYTATWKTKGEKLFEITREGLKLCIAGAGYVSHIRKAVQIMRTAVASEKYNLDLGGVMKLTEDTLRIIYQDYIDTYPVEEARKPHLFLLVGMWSARSGLALLDTERTTANIVDDYAVMGTGGQSLAQYVVDTVRGFNRSVAQTKLLALYALQAAKDYDLFSGKETRLKTLRADGEIENAGAAEIGNAENYFSDLFSSIHYILTTMVDLPEMSDEEIARDADIKGVISRFRERERQRKEAQRKATELLSKYRQKKV